MANVNGSAPWTQWLVHGLVTVTLAALAAFGGMRVGIAEMKETQLDMEKRLNRIEDKLDRLIERQYQ